MGPTTSSSGRPRELADGEAFQAAAPVALQAGPFDAAPKARAAAALSAATEARLRKSLAASAAAAGLLALAWLGVEPELERTLTGSTGEAGQGGSEHGRPNDETNRTGQALAAMPDTAKSEEAAPDTDGTATPGEAGAQHRWTAWAGMWRIADGWLEATGGRGRKATIDGLQLTNLSAETRVRMLPGSVSPNPNAGLIYRVNNPDSANDGFEDQVQPMPPRVHDPPSNVVGRRSDAAKRAAPCRPLTHRAGASRYPGRRPVDGGV